MNINTNFNVRLGAWCSVLHLIISKNEVACLLFEKWKRKTSFTFLGKVFLQLYQLILTVLWYKKNLVITASLFSKLHSLNLNKECLPKCSKIKKKKKLKKKNFMFPTYKTKLKPIARWTIITLTTTLIPFQNLRTRNILLFLGIDINLDASRPQTTMSTE